MPRCNGLAGVRLIKAEFPDVKIVMLTMSEDDNDLFEAIKNGASGYILKNVKPTEFLDLLAGVVRGEAAITREMATRIMQEFTHQNGGVRDFFVLRRPDLSAFGKRPAVDP